MAKIHTVRAADGGTATLSLCASQAIKLMCVECLGFEGNPKTDCQSPLCPLFPWRGRTLASHKAGDYSQKRARSEKTGQKPTPAPDAVSP